MGEAVFVGPDDPRARGLRGQLRGVRVLARVVAHRELGALERGVAYGDLLAGLRVNLLDGYRDGVVLRLFLQGAIDAAHAGGLARDDGRLVGARVLGEARGRLVFPDPVGACGQGAADGVAVAAGLEAVDGLGAGLVGVDAVDGAFEAVAGVAGRHLGLCGHLVELERASPLGHGLVALNGGNPGGCDGHLLDLGVDCESGRGGDLLDPVGAGGQGLRHGVAAQAVLGRALLGRHLGDELGAGLVGVDAVDGAAVGRALGVGGGGVLPQLDVALGAALDDVAVDVLGVAGEAERLGVVEGRADEALHGEAGHEAVVARGAVLAPKGLEGGAELAARRLVGQAGAHRDAAGVVPVDVVALGGVADGFGDPYVVGRAGLEDRGAVLDHEGEGGGHDEVLRGVHPRGVGALASVLVGRVALLREGEHRLTARVVGGYLRPAHRGCHAARADVLQVAN